MKNSQINPWMRADLERYNPETLALVRTGDRPEYTRIMRELAHSKTIAMMAIERVTQIEGLRADFFAGQTDNVIELPLATNVVQLDAYRPQDTPA